MQENDMNVTSDTLKEFICKDIYKSAIFKGQWGIGKTFYWHKFVRDNMDVLKDSFQAYSYVSVFGASTISDIKTSIFNNYKPTDNKSRYRHIDKLKPHIKILKSLNLPYLDSTDFISDYLENNLFKNMLICFDDLERKEEDISMSSLLGLITHLKEEKGCKIILIHNDEGLDEINLNKFNEYRDKVFDLELSYMPSIDSNLSIIWPKGIDHSTREVFQLLNLNNIRIMQRVKWAQEYFYEFISNNYTHLNNAFMLKCTKMAIIYHAYGKKYKLAELTKENTLARLLSTYKNGPTDENEDGSLDILKILEYRAEDQDIIIANYLTNGYVNFLDYKELLDAAETAYQKGNVEGKYWDTWKKYSDNFAIKQDEFISQLQEFIKTHAKDLSLYHVSESIKFLSDMSPEIDLDKLLDDSIEKYVSENEEIRERDLTHPNMPRELIDRILEKAGAKGKKYTLLEIFKSLAGSNSWTPEEVNRLGHFEASDFVNWLTNENDGQVIQLVRNFKNRFHGDNEIEISVLEKLNHALEIMKNRSALDKDRVEKLIN
ncbi:MAG: hypothetical protein O7G85_13870 [Planctomycetota bacterium]|nr:hypothetical protein [Planctomycetota bacterium]